MGVTAGRRAFMVALALALVSSSGCRRSRRVSSDPGPNAVAAPGDPEASETEASLPSSPPAAAHTPATLESAASAVQPSVVSVRAATSRGSGTGSGFVLDTAGHIVTNAHIVKGVRTVRLVLPDNRTVAATVVGRQDAADIAVLRTSASGLRPAPLGRSAELQVGDSVLAVGAPLASSGTISSGIVSALKREVALAGSGAPEVLIQTDAAVDQGDSGGPLVDPAGQVVGVTTAVAAPGIGLGYAVPIERATGIARGLIG